MAFRVITRTLGIPIEDEPAVLAWGRTLLRFVWEPEPALESADRMRAYLGGVVSARRADPGDDLISDLTRAEYEGRRLEDEEIFASILSVFAAGIDSPSNTLGSLIHAVLSRPELEARLRCEPDLLAGTVEETLRWEPSPAVMPRKCPEATRWRGVDFPANSAVVFGIASANRDPDAFHDPDRFDPDREMNKTLVNFGQGLHLCLGAHLARHAMQTALRTLLGRLPDIQFAEGNRVEIVGGVLRGPDSLPATRCWCECEPPASATPMSTSATA
jgi:cytochrome P450